METKIEALDSEAELEALHSGLVAAELCGLFFYFLHHTEEGKAIKKQIDADWQTQCTVLRTGKKIIGSDFSCGQWLRVLSKKLLRDADAKAAHRAASATHRSPVSRPKKLKFKNTRSSS